MQQYNLKSHDGYIENKERERNLPFSKEISFPKSESGIQLYNILHQTSSVIAELMYTRASWIDISKFCLEYEGVDAFGFH